MPSIAAQPVHDDNGPLSAWWLRTVIAVMVLGFSGLIAITFMAYRNAPPIPERVVDEQASTVFTREDILEGQTVFLKYGLMANGSIWGHGAYLGPDYSAQALHRLGELTADDVARKRFGMPFAALTKPQQAGIAGEAAALLKVNRHDDATQTLRFSAPEVVAYREQIIHWTDYFRDPSRNGGLKADLITDPAELRHFAAFVSWTAWASVASRPGESYSYTNNFPYDPSVGNVPPSGALLWSALSLMVLLAGIATVLLAFGKFDYLG